MFDDGLAFARYVDEAAEGFFRFLLGRRVAHIIATAFAQPDHNLSYQNVTFAERDNIIVGMFSGHTAEQHRRSSRQPLKRAAGRRNLRMRIVLMLFAPLIRVTDSIADGDFYLQFIAVDKALRGDGVGFVLMDSFEEHARAHGSTRLSLDVSGKQDLVVQLVKACSNNDHFWVFAQASTNVGFNMKVTDTETGDIRSYSNRLGQPFQAITDTSAFATCP